MKAEAALFSNSEWNTISNVEQSRNSTPNASFRTCHNCQDLSSSTLPGQFFESCLRKQAPIVKMETPNFKILSPFF